MKNPNRFLSLVSFTFLVTSTSYASLFYEKIPVYGVVKPGAISTSLAINHGIVSEIRLDVGDIVKTGGVLLGVLEKETIRSYKSSLNGQIAKWHITQGAVVSPGMPLVTVLNPKKKKFEVSLSPAEARKVSIGSSVFLGQSSKPFGEVTKISPLVDPDNGSVLSYIKPLEKSDALIGDVLSMNIVTREIKNCKIVKINEVSIHLEKYRIEALSGNSACLLEK